MQDQVVSIRDPEKTILSLRDAIPPVMCKSTCTDCCGCVPWSHWEWEQLPGELKAGLVVNEIIIKPPYKAPARKVIIPLKYELKGASLILLYGKDLWMELFTARCIKANKCVFLTKDERGCTVYPYRPIICRLFGTIADPRAACKHGCTSFPQLHWRLGVAMTEGWFQTMQLL